MEPAEVGEVAFRRLDGRRGVADVHVALVVERLAAADASGLSNMLRNLGGVVGTATLSTVLTKREQFHSNIIGQAVTLTRDEVRQRISDLTAYFMARGVPDPAHAQHQAIMQIGRIVRQQALIMAFSDAFAVIGVLLAAAAIAVLFARRSAPRMPTQARINAGRSGTRMGTYGGIPPTNSCAR